MKLNKGDLIAVKTVEEKRITAIVISVFKNNKYFYCYEIDSGVCRLVYEKEVEFIISEGFDPDFEIDDNLFDLDYSFYEACSHAFAYTPYFGFPYSYDHDDEE